MADPQGIVFDIREFCLHDGPGVRTTVFLKGCPLRCLWCHNPEGQERRPQIMHSTTVECIGCGNCRKVCAHSDGCVACGACVPVCPVGRIHLCGESVSPSALAERVLKDRHMFESSGGGVTFSGGEPLTQIDFLCASAHLLSPLNIAVETSGYSSKDVYLRMLEVTSFVLQDWKCASDALHRQLTGVSNECIRANIKILARSRRDFVLRLPLVPGLNDGDSELEAAADFFAEIRTPGLKEIQLLPYHGGAETKFRQLGIKHQPLRLESNLINKAAVDIFTSRSLPCSYPFGSEVGGVSLM